jgi:hypothetical protein
MATYLITAPDGRKYRVTGEGTKEEALAHFQSRFNAQPAFDRDAFMASEREKYSPTGTGTENFLAGAGKAFSDLGFSARQFSTELGNAVGLGRIMPGSFGDQEVMRQQQEAAERQRRDQPLMDTTAGFAGNITGNIAAAAPTMMIPGANTVAGASLTGAGMGMLQPAASSEERVMNTGLGAGLGAVGQWGGGKIADWAGDALTSRAANAATQRAQNTVRDATLRQAMDEGFVVPPTTTNPTTINRVLESVAGKISTQQAASESNQAITNRLVRRDLGLADDAPLTKDTLSYVRRQAGKVYDQVKQTGQIVADYQYMTDLSDLVQTNSALQKSFPGAAKVDSEVESLVNTLSRQQFDADGAVEMIKKLRSDSKSNFTASAISGDPAKRQLAQAQWEAAGALEDQIERHLQQIGQAPLMMAFREARQLIAKSHSAEMALNEGTGNIQASKLVQQLRKGKPLSGGFETIAKFAAAVPKAMKDPTESGGVNALTAMLAGGGAVGLGAPQLLALPAARWGTRKALMTPAAQRRLAIPSYRPGRIGTLSLQGARGLGQVSGPLSIAAYAAEQ